MPLYSYECCKESCAHQFDEAKPMSESSGPSTCPKCQAVANRIITLRSAEPTFTQRLYPFYHQGIGEVVNSESHLNKRCSELGFYSKHEGAQMSYKQERMLMSKRSQAKPRETVEKPTWSGRGAAMPSFETFEK